MMEGYRKSSGKRTSTGSNKYSDARSVSDLDYYGLQRAEGDRPQIGSVRASNVSSASTKKLRILSRNYPGTTKEELISREEQLMQEDGSTWDSTMVLVLIFTALALILLIIVVIYIYLGTLIYRSEHPSPFYGPERGKFDEFYFGLDPKNFSDAMESCRRKDMGLAMLFSNYEENSFFDKIFTNATITDQCESIFVGYRIAPDKEWIGPDNTTAFGAMFSEMWEQTTYDLELETCSQAIKVADYRLNNVLCSFPSDCAFCETAFHCLDSKPVCYFLEGLFPKANHSTAEELCQRNYNGHLALIRSEALRIGMKNILDREDPLHICKSIAIGMNLKRQVETVHGLEMAYESTRLKLDQGDAMNYCLSAKVKDDDAGMLSTQSCTDHTCYVCRK